MAPILAGPVLHYLIRYQVYLTDEDICFMDRRDQERLALSKHWRYVNICVEDNLILIS